MSVFEFRVKMLMLFLISFFPGRGTLLAQTEYMLNGQVRDSRSLLPLAGVNVIISGTNRGDDTDDEGNYIIEGISEGIFTLQASMTGYKSERLRISVPGEGDLLEITNMSNTSFYASFKQRYRMTYKDYLLNTRVGYACKLLTEASQNISGIAYVSGFGNISNFNRQFKKIKGITPSQFQEQIKRNEFGKS